MASRGRKMVALALAKKGQVKCTGKLAAATHGTLADLKQLQRKKEKWESAAAETVFTCK